MSIAPQWTTRPLRREENTMQTLRFEGYSDDTFAETRSAKIDYDNCASGEPIQFLIEDPHGLRLLVTGMYIHTGIWMVGISQAEEDAPLPPWPMRWGARGYTTTLELDVPNGTKIACITGA